MPLTARDEERIRQQVWTNPDSYATTLLTLFLDQYGTEGLDWDANTCVLEIEGDFRVMLPQLSLDRLMVGCQLLTTDYFYKSLPDFNTFCTVLGGHTHTADLWQPADALEIAWGVTEALLLSPPEQQDEAPFTDEIRDFIGHVLDQEGIIHPPDILRLASRMRDHWSNIQADYSDDPVMFGAIYDVESSKTDDITGQLRKNLSALSDQLRHLPLRTGRAHDVIRLLSQNTTA